jgi:predicted HTH transcriptional regulator
MRRAHICEERGSGWDKIALQCEIHQLPSPKVDIYTDSTRVTLFSYIPFNKIPLKEKKWCCYMHACLKQVRGEQMTNTSLRDRFGLSEGGKSAISRLITSSIEDGLIKALDPNTAPRYMSYVPFWA